MDSLKPDWTAAFVERARTGLMRIRPRSRDTYYPVREVYRTVAETDSGLRQVFRELMAGQKPWPLFLCGPVGTGKTCAALSLCDAVEFGRYWTVGRLLDLMLRKAAPWDTYWAWNGTPQLAVLDELGTRKATDFEYDAVKRFADWRVHRPTVYISNQSPKMIRQLYDRRIESRITCGTVFELNGEDRRKQAAKAAGGNNA